MKHMNGLLVMSAVLAAGCTMNVSHADEGTSSSPARQSSGGSERPTARAGEPAESPPPAAAPAEHACPEVRDNRQRIALEEGVYRCDIDVRGNNNELVGAGPGRTIIEGTLRVRGNNNSVTGVTVRGATEVPGNNNDVRGNDLEGPVEIRGNNNRR